VNLSSPTLLPTTVSHTEIPRANATIKTKGYQLLLLDDSTTVLNVMSAILRRIPGILLTIESSPCRALDILERDLGNFDLVLTDIKMPEMDGIEFAANVKQLRPELPILAVTSSPLAVDRKPDFAGIVPKPFSPEELVAGVTGFLREFQPPSLSIHGTQHRQLI